MFGKANRTDTTGEICVPIEVAQRIATKGIGEIVPTSVIIGELPSPACKPGFIQIRITKGFARVKEILAEQEIPYDVLK